MPTLQAKASRETKSWYSNVRYTAGAEVGLHGLVLAIDQLLSLAESEELTEQQMKNCLSAYVELTDSIRSAHGRLEDADLTLQVIGKVLLGKI